MKRISTFPLALAFLAALGFAWASGGGGTSAPASSLPDLTVFQGCGLEGSATSDTGKALNLLKNRYAGSGGSNLAITLASLTASGDDTGRWRPNDGAEFVGHLVAAYDAGSREAANCGAVDPDHLDTHIEVAADPAQTDPTRRVIVEITPRTRHLAFPWGSDWSSATLRGSLYHHWVRFHGGMLFDTEHADESLNTAPADWRATAWEIHPVTSL